MLSGKTETDLSLHDVNNHTFSAAGQYVDQPNPMTRRLFLKANP